MDQLYIRPSWRRSKFVVCTAHEQAEPISESRARALSSMWCCHSRAHALGLGKETATPSTPMTHHNTPSSPRCYPGLWDLPLGFWLGSETPTINLPPKVSHTPPRKSGVSHYIWKQTEACQWLLFAFNSSPHLGCGRLNICTEEKIHTDAYWQGIPHGKRCRRVLCREGCEF